METFAPGDRVVAINTDMSGPILAAPRAMPGSFHFPDGHLRGDQVYHVASVQPLTDGSQGVFLTGVRVYLGSRKISWHHSRFRKVETLRTRTPKKRRRKGPATPVLLGTP